MAPRSTARAGSWLQRTREDAGYSSNEKLADEVLQRWKKSEPRGRKPAKRSIAAKLSLFEKDDPVWWRNHENAAAALAEALGVDLAALPLARSEESLVEFPDFPELPPLDVRSEEPCRLAQIEPWAAAMLLQSTPRCWFQLPPGAGKSLAARYHRVRGLAQVVEVSRLDDLSSVRRESDAVVVVVAMADPEKDLQAVEALEQQGGIVVLASFPLPQRPRSEGDGFSFQSPPSPWRTLMWQPVEDWERRLLTWIAGRMEWASERQVDEIAAWLAELDPQGQLFQSPGDVLPLVAFAYRHARSRRRPRGDIARIWLQDHLGRLASDQMARSIWLRAVGQEALRELTVARFAAVEHGWEVPIERRQWASLLPERLGPADVVGKLRKEIERVVELPHRKERGEAMRKLLDELGHATAQEAVDHLISARLLREVEPARYTLAPRWLGEWWASERVQKVLATESPAVWGRWAADPSRCVLVDAQLDTVSNELLGQLVQRVVAEFDRSQLGWVGATEALFAAVARRLDSERDLMLPVHELHALFRLQENTLVPRWAQHIGEPITRCELYSSSGSATWIADCWTWSLRVPPPEPALPAAYDWLYPGWCSPSLGSVPNWLYSIDREGIDSGLCRRLRRMVPSVLARCRDEKLPESHLPSLFMLDLYLMARDRGWILGIQHVRYIVSRDWDEVLFAEYIGRLSDERKRALAEDLWVAFVEPPGAHDEFSQLVRQAPAALRFLVDWLPPEQIEHTFREGRLDWRLLSWDAPWPAAFWVAGVRGALARDIGVGRQLLSDRRPWQQQGAAAVEIVETLIAHDPDGWQAVQLLWRLAPERALAHARAAYPEAANAVHWFFEADGQYFSQLLDMIETHLLRPCPNWARSWLARHLPARGITADRIYRLLAQS